MRLRLALAATLLAGSAAAAADSGPMPADQPVDGRSQAQWTRAWWQWASSFDQAASPVADTTGERCRAGQAGPVFFLAGTYGTHRTIRTCTMPAGKFVFFPLLNYLVMRPQERQVGCAAVTAYAHDSMEGATHLVLRIDGVEQGGLEKHRLDSDGCFDVGVRRTPPASIWPSAADGYYVMLRPLAPGRHTLDFGGVLPGDMIQAVSYVLDVR